MEHHDVICGIIMPISGTDDYPEDHWKDVIKIISETVNSITEYSFSVKPVWHEEYVNIIQKSIVNNIYQADIIICDVSSMNPNVLFELGLRLAFDKPVIIMIDNNTKLNFDTGIIEHLIYDSDMNYFSIKSLRFNLKTKILATLKEVYSNENYSPFLSNFGTFHTSSLHSEDIDSADQLVDMLSNIQNELTFLRRKYSIHSSLLKVDPEYVEYLIDKAINMWCNKHVITDSSDLINDVDFIKWVECEINSSRYFDSPDEFTDALNVVLSRHKGGA